jgi:hypothetical protein
MLKAESDQPFQEKPTPLAPFEIHAFWYLSPEEFGTEFEWRLVFLTPEGDVPAEEVFPMKSDNKRYRIRIMGFPILATGQVSLQVEWREKGSQKWNRCSVFWPMDIDYVSSTIDTPPPDSNSLPKK